MSHLDAPAWDRCASHLRAWWFLRCWHLNWTHKNLLQVASSLSHPAPCVACLPRQRALHSLHTASQSVQFAPAAGTRLSSAHLELRTVGWDGVKRGFFCCRDSTRIATQERWWGAAVEWGAFCFITSSTEETGKHNGRASSAHHCCHFQIPTHRVTERVCVLDSQRVLEVGLLQAPDFYPAWHQWQGSASQVLVEDKLLHWIKLCLWTWGLFFLARPTPPPNPSAPRDRRVRHGELQVTDRFKTPNLLDIVGIPRFPGQDGG